MNLTPFQKLIDRNAIPVYSGILFVTSITLTILSIATHNANFTFINVLIPTTTAILLTGLVQGKKGILQLTLKSLRKKVTIQWWIISVFLFPLFAYIAFLLGTGKTGTEFFILTPRLFPHILTILVISFGEEFGWRGFLLPRLMEKHNAVVSSLILGSIWGIWHFPGYLIGTGVPISLSFIAFLIWIVSATLLITWVYNNTGSILTAILLHASANAVFTYFPILPIAIGSSLPFWLFLCLINFMIILIIAISGVERMVKK